MITLRDMKKGEFEVLAQVLSLDLCQQCGSNAGVASWVVDGFPSLRIGPNPKSLGTFCGMGGVLSVFLFYFMYLMCANKRGIPEQSPW